MGELVKSEYAALSKQGDAMEILRINTGEQGLSDPNLLDRVSLPAGGGTTWSVPSLEGETPMQEIRGIIVAFKDVRAYWEQSFEDSGGGVAPDCYSNDGVHGEGDPGGVCRECPLNEYGSASKGAGKACKEMRMIFLLQEHDQLPLIITAPPTSLKKMHKYFLRLVKSSLPYYAVETSLSLEVTKNNAGIKYSVINPKVVRTLDSEEVQAVKKYSDGIQAFVRQQVIDVEDVGAGIE